MHAGEVRPERWLEFTGVASPLDLSEYNLRDMTIEGDLRKAVSAVLAPTWDVRLGRVVPATRDVKLKDGAVKLQATYVYADMANSTRLAQRYNAETAAKVIRCYLSTASRCLGSHSGQIRSFDGDRVMAVFVGDNKNLRAVKAAMNLSWAVTNIIMPQLSNKWPSFDWKMKHGVGIDTGTALIVRAGVRGSNDLISIGGTPNIAAKLSDIRTPRPLHISHAVFSSLPASLKWTDPTTKRSRIWKDEGQKDFGGKYIHHYSAHALLAP